jgi:rhizosphere induced protein
MRNIRSGFVAMMALCLLAGTAGVAQAATPSGRTIAAAGYGNGPGSSTGRTCHHPTPYGSGPGATSSAKTRKYCGPGGSLPTYSLQVTNSSSKFEDLVLYQKPDDLGLRNALPIAWLTAPAFPGTTVVFRWTQDYSFMASQTGSFRPGIVFRPQATVATDPDNESVNHIRLASNGGGVTFVRDNDPARRGSLAIRQEAGVPRGSAAVGIGMSNEPIFAVQAEPNVNLTLTPHPDYWVTAGTYERGQALDADRITNEAHLPFGGTTAMTAVLDAAGHWSVRNGN